MAKYGFPCALVRANRNVNPVPCEQTMSTSSTTSGPSALSGFVLVLIQFDVCEELRLDQLQQTVSARTVQKPSMKHSAPAYVRYQRPPVVEPLEPLILESGERLE